MRTRYNVAMRKTLEIQGVPDDIHRQLEERAKSEGVSLSEFLLPHLAEMALNPPTDRSPVSRAEMWTRLKSRERVHLSSSVADLVREHRGPI